MKKVIIGAAFLCTSFQSFSQKDSTNAKVENDTIRAGNFVIIKNKSNKTESGKTSSKTDAINIIINKTTQSKQSNISTNWWIFDLGFANFRDQTNYAAANALNPAYLTTVHNSQPLNSNSFNLNTGKSSNVNIWVFMQKLNISKHVLNLKYGLGLEMYNFRYDKSISYRNNPQPFVFNDTISFSKNKLYTGYLTVPLMLNVNATPGKKNGFSFSAGVSAGYLLSAYNKQISSERGKQKYRGNLNINPWRLAAISELGLGPVRLYGSYSLNTIHDKKTGLEQYPYCVGIRFSNW